MTLQPIHYTHNLGSNKADPLPGHLEQLPCRNTKVMP